jgi:hypothetical protein
MVSQSLMPVTPVSATAEAACVRDPSSLDFPSPAADTIYGVERLLPGYVP